jgi:FtsH-binding integral membrane protein
MQIEQTFGISVPLVLGQLLALAISVTVFVFWLWMLVECVRRKDMTDNQKLVWVLVLVLVNCIGSIVYFFASDRSKRRFS